MDPHNDEAPPNLGVRSALYIDFDGTLVELAPRPDGVSIEPALQTLLQNVASLLGGAVAVITGRPLTEIDRHFAPARLPGAGLHGAELRPRAGAPVQRESGVSLRSLVEGLRRRFGDDERVLIEDKGPVVALHYRLAPERAQECESQVRALVDSPDLEIITGRAVVEVRARGVDKGNALRMLAGEAPFSGREPVFVGDDRADEDGFAAAQALGGFGVKVGDGKTLARYRCRTVREVHAWLHASLGDASQ